MIPIDGLSHGSLPINPLGGLHQENLWAPLRADATEIHFREFKYLLDVYDWVAEQGLSAGALMTGLPGSGRTHILARLREYLDGANREALSQRAQAIFVSVRLQSNALFYWRDILHALIQDLMRSDKAQFQRLIRTAIRHHGLNPDAPDAFDELMARVYDEAPFDPNWALALKFLWLGRDCHSAVDYLLGYEPDPLEARRLGFEDVPRWPTRSPETQARALTGFLCRLGAPGAVFVFCFERLEASLRNLDDSASVKTFVRIVAQFRATAPNTFQVLCAQPNFAHTAQLALPAEQYDILTENTFSLEPLARQDVERLLSNRLDGYPPFAEGRRQLPDARLHPFRERDLDSLMRAREAPTPSEALGHFARRLDAMVGRTRPARELNEWIQEAWERRRAERDFAEDTLFSDNWLFERDLAHGLPLLIGLAQKGWRSFYPSATTGPAISMTGPNRRRIAVCFCNERALATLDANLRRWRYNAQLGEYDRWVLVRNPNLPISADAHRIRKQLAFLGRVDVRFWTPAPEAMADLRAVRRLIRDALCGDLTAETQRISAATVGCWLADNAPPSLTGVIRRLLPLAGRPTRVQELLPEALRLLERHYMIDVNQAASELGCLPVELEELALLAPDQIGALSGPPKLLFLAPEASVESAAATELDIG